MLHYSAGSDVGQINLQGREEVLFDVYSQQIDRDVAAYEATITRNRENGSKGGRPRKNPENPVVFSETQKSQDKDKGKDKEKDEYEDKYDTSGIYAREAAADDRPDFNTVEVYATNNLSVMTAGNMQEFADFKEHMSDDLLRYAIDDAAAHGKRTWAYVRGILLRYKNDGITNVGEAKAAEEKRVKGKPQQSAQRSNMNYTQREYADDFGFYNPAEDYGNV